jgi:lysophospholipase L1-like esterase
MKKTEITMKKYIILISLFCLLVISIYAKNYTCFDVVGDSISAGVNPDDGIYGWVHMLFGEGTPPKENTIDDLFPGITKHNSAISGSTAKQWAVTNPNYLLTVLNHHPDLVVVYIGGNDFLWDYCLDGQFTQAEIDEYTNNLRIIINTLQTNIPSPDIILITYYDLFDGESENLPSTFEHYRIVSEGTIIGDSVISQVASEKGCRLVDIYDDFMYHCYGVDVGGSIHYSPDYVDRPLIPDFDIHPNTDGHNKIYEEVFAMLQHLAETSSKTWEFYD